MAAVVKTYLQKRYEQFILKREIKMFSRTINRTSLPFSWGLEYLASWETSLAFRLDANYPLESLQELNRRALQCADQLYRHCPVDFRLQDNVVSFTSIEPSPHPENQLVVGRWFPASNQSSRAIIIIPHWNARADQYIGAAKLFSRLGISTLRLTMPYHEHRRPAGVERAEYAVSANIGRTLAATRQAILDIRCAIDWLQKQGFHRIGLFGTSLGSCYAYLTASVDPRVKALVCNHFSAYFAEVVWTGLSTRHVRQAMEGHIDLPQLRSVWEAITPENFVTRFLRWKRPSLFIYGTYDTSFLPEYSQRLIDVLHEQGSHPELLTLPCGHYTLALFPFNLIVGWKIVSFFLRCL